MRRGLGIVAAVLIVASGATAVWLYSRVQELEVVGVTHDLHVVRGAGGNVAILTTSAGAVVVDSMTFRIQGERLRELAERLTGGPVQALINTHYHQDHTHGNLGFAPGTRVVATERTREYLDAFDSRYWQGRGTETLPSDLFADERELRLGGKTIRAIHPGPGHTGGDLVVLFVEDRVVHAGDLFFNRRYPRVDAEAGGSIRAWIESIDRVLSLDFDVVIPGHGEVSDREGLVAFQRFLVEVLGLVEAALAKGLSLEETLEGAELEEDAGYEYGGFPPFVVFDRESVIRSAWRELAGGDGGAA